MVWDRSHEFVASVVYSNDLRVNMTLIWWCFETPLTVWLCRASMCHPAGGLLSTPMPGPQSGRWHPSLSHLAGSSSGWSALTQTMRTCIPRSAPRLLRANTRSTRSETNSHTNTLQTRQRANRGHAGVRISYSSIQQTFVCQCCGGCGSSGQLKASGEAGGGRVGTTCKVSVNNSARVKLCDPG